MTINQAIEDIKELYQWYFEEEPLSEHMLVYEAVTKAIDALEKQIPIPKHKYMGFRCICGKEVAKEQVYCEYCGQKLLPWSEVK